MTETSSKHEVFKTPNGQYTIKFDGKWWLGLNVNSQNLNHTGAQHYDTIEEVDKKIRQHQSYVGISLELVKTVTS